MLFDDQEVSTATCFYWSYHEEPYLISNWHNFSGKNPITGKHLSPKLCEPNKIKFDVFFNKDVTTRGWEILPIEDEDGPLWLEHPNFSKDIDVACLKLPLYLKEEVFVINDLNNENMSVRVADEVFILGFPLGIVGHL